MSGKVSYNVCFHDLEMGLQTHCYAPMGLNIRGKWTLGGSLPGEPVVPVELGMGAPLQGLWLREDVDMKCNIMMTSFVKKTLKKAHGALVERLLHKASIANASLSNQRVNDKTLTTQGASTASQAPTQYSSTSDCDSQSLIEEAASDSLNPHGPQSPPSHRLSFRGPEHHYFRDKTNYNDNSLYPRALSIQSSSTSRNGSMTGSQQGRSSFHDSMQGGQTARVSWQNPNPKQSQSMRPVDPAYQSANPCRSSQSAQLVDHSYHVELPFQETEDSDSEDSSRQYERRYHDSFPPHVGTVELE
jgi:hypothetical protein